MSDKETLIQHIHEAFAETEYPGDPFLLGSRVGRFGADVSASYSMVCYKESSEAVCLPVMGQPGRLMPLWRAHSLRIP